MMDIQKFLDEHFSPDEPIILACSTGPDSMFLLYQILQTSYKKNLVACYFNHKLRPQADDEEIFLENLGKKLWFQVEIASADIKKIRDTLYPSISLEELAREKRYMFFGAICEIYNTKKIITWHHLDDKIETFFFNLARGSKLTGLINMTKNYGNILRPLLDMEKKEIIDFLDENQLEYKIDHTNFDLDITRNRIRHNILPEFSHINSQYKKNISHTLNYFEELKEHIDTEIKNFLQNNRHFRLTDFFQLSLFLQKEIIRYMFYISNGNSTIGLSEKNIQEILKFFHGKNNPTTKTIKQLSMNKKNDFLYF